MKNLFVAFAAFTILFLTGCRENSFDPVTGPSPKDAAADAAVTEGVIPLTGELAIPGSGHMSYTIKGEIKYSHKLVAPNWDIPESVPYIDLFMNAHATFRGNPYSDHPDSWIDSKSEDVLYVSQDGILILEKNFNLRGSDEGMVLVCRFIVTTDGVSLDAMRLALYDDNG